MSKSVSEKKHMSERGKESAKMKVKNLVGRKIMEDQRSHKDPTGDGCQGRPRDLVM